MKEKRIIKETRKNGKISYRVEEKITLFGITIFDWNTDIVYDTLIKAQRRINIDTNPIVKKEEIKIK